MKQFLVLVVSNQRLTSAILLELKSLGLCGSVFLDQRFEQYIRGKLGDKVIDSMKPRSKAAMMRSWETV